ncbi:MAG TPA: hypothetical protein VLB07_02610 [Woeseiaceae bacterium]|nr:hypothetical protein [Woeseiaceae bacterium]
MLLRRISAHIRAQNWFAVMLDLLVVVVGLFLGLQIDTWWEGQKEARIESTYLQEIREDFVLNRASLLDQISDAEQIIRGMIALHEQSTLDVPTLSIAELNETFTLINHMPTFVIATRAYGNLIGSGDLKVLRNRELKNLLAAYYAAANLTAVVQTTHEMELVQTFQPYMIDNLDYAAVTRDLVDDFPLTASSDDARILEVLDTRQFRNVVVQKWVISTDLLNQFRSMLKRTDEVLQMLQ